MRQEHVFPRPHSPVRVRVSGALVARNKNDGGDRPCLWVFVPCDAQDEYGLPSPWAGEETLVHEVEFTGSTTLHQDFTDSGGCPVTGAVMWLQTESPVMIYWREEVKT